MTKRRSKRAVTREQLGKLGFQSHQLPMVEAVQDLERKDATAEAQKSERLRTAASYIGQRVEERTEEQRRREAERRQQQADFDEIRAKSGYGLSVISAGPPISDTTGYPIGKYNEYRKMEREREDAEVDQEGPTITRTRSGTVSIRRGCIVCGIARTGPTRRGYPGKLPAGGPICKKCDQAIAQASSEIGNRIELGRELAEKGAGQTPSLDSFGLAVTRRLRAERPDLVGESVDVMADWQSVCWAVRVMNSDKPETQEPPTQPFGYLAPPRTLADFQRGLDDAGS